MTPLRPDDVHSARAWAAFVADDAADAAPPSLEARVLRAAQAALAQKQRVDAERARRRWFAGVSAIAASLLAAAAWSLAPGGLTTSRVMAPADASRAETTPESSAASTTPESSAQTADEPPGRPVPMTNIEAGRVPVRRRKRRRRGRLRRRRSARRLRRGHVVRPGQPTWRERPRSSREEACRDRADAGKPSTACPLRVGALLLRQRGLCRAHHARLERRRRRGRGVVGHEGGPRPRAVRVVRTKRCHAGHRTCLNSPDIWCASRTRASRSRSSCRPLCSRDRTAPTDAPTTAAASSYDRSCRSHSTISSR